MLIKIRGIIAKFTFIKGNANLTLRIYTNVDFGSLALKPTSLSNQNHKLCTCVCGHNQMEHMETTPLSPTPPHPYPTPPSTPPSTPPHFTHTPPHPHVNEPRTYGPILFPSCTGNYPWQPSECMVKVSVLQAEGIPKNNWELLYQMNISHPTKVTDSPQTG